jgi:hypothetical protein
VQLFFDVVDTFVSVDAIVSVVSFDAVDAMDARFSNVIDFWILM